MSGRDIRLQVVEDIDECERLWRTWMPTELVSDLWEIRCCFHRRYRHRPHFVVAEDAAGVCGFLPLSWNEETGQYGYFPGETWEGKTWLEQNRIVARDDRVLAAMLESLDHPYQLRYLRSERSWFDRHGSVDEVGYLFLPDQYDYSLDTYLGAFSHKTGKKLRKELAGWQSRDVRWRFNDVADFELLAGMNRSRFGRLSYFHDERFLASFRDLAHLLDARDWLRMVTVLVDGEPAAVDMGSLFNGMLTMLAGGTNERFPGIAKLINMHHLGYACAEKLDSVDFLCGDFNWKTLFHLTPAPLYKLESPQVPAGVCAGRQPTVFGMPPVLNRHFGATNA